MGIIDRTTSIQATLETIEMNLKTYAVEMGPDRAYNADTAIRQQTNMLSVLKAIFRLEDDNFNEAFKVFLGWVKSEINKSMGPGRFRGLQVAKKIGKKDHSAIVLIVNLAAMLADDAAREQIVVRFDYGRLDNLWPQNTGGDKLRNYFASR